MLTFPSIFFILIEGRENIIPFNLLPFHSLDQTWTDWMTTTAERDNLNWKAMKSRVDTSGATVVVVVDGAPVSRPFIQFIPFANKSAPIRVKLDIWCFEKRNKRLKPSFFQVLQNYSFAVHFVFRGRNSTFSPVAFSAKSDPLHFRRKNRNVIKGRIAQNILFKSAWRWNKHFGHGNVQSTSGTSPLLPEITIEIDSLHFPFHFFLVGSRNNTPLPTDPVPPGWNAVGFEGRQRNPRETGEKQTEATESRARGQAGQGSSGGQVRGVLRTDAEGTEERVWRSNPGRPGATRQRIRGREAMLPTAVSQETKFQLFLLSLIGSYSWRSKWILSRRRCDWQKARICLAITVKWPHHDFARYLRRGNFCF